MALFLAATGVAAAGLLGAEAAAQSNRRRRRWQMALAADPDLRAELSARMAFEALRPTMLLLVHVEGAQLAPKLAGKDLRVCVKLGEPGNSIPQRTGTSRSGVDGQVYFGSTFAFPWHPYSMAPVVRVRLEKAGIIERTIAKEEFWLPFHGTPETIEQDLLFYGRKQELFGTLHVTCQLQAVPAGDLHMFGLLGGMPHLPAFEVPPYTAVYPRVRDDYGRHNRYVYDGHIVHGAVGSATAASGAADGGSSGLASAPAAAAVVGRPVRQGEAPAAAQGVVFGSTSPLPSAAAKPAATEGKGA
jgi:hypothetical protein